MTDDRPPVTVYADFVCPFCYLGMDSMGRYLESTADPPPVEWHPFDLRAGRRGPDGSLDEDADGWKDEAYFERAQENVARLAERYGVEMLQQVATDVDSWDAQKLALHVWNRGDREAAAALNEAVFAALWRDGRDIGDVEVLEDVAASAGVSPSEVRAALEDEALEEQLRSAFEAARRRGVTGVPTFVYGERAARGAVPPEQLERLVEG